MRQHREFAADLWEPLAFSFLALLNWYAAFFFLHAPPRCLLRVSLSGLTRWIQEAAAGTTVRGAAAPGSTGGGGKYADGTATQVSPAASAPN